MHFDFIIDTIYLIENKQFIYKCNHVITIGLMSNECLYDTKFKKCDSLYFNNKISNLLYLSNLLV